MLLAHELVGHTDDPALVLIHGITDSRRMWHPLVHELAQHHLVLTVDLRGHGESDDDDGYDPASYAADVVETAQALGVERPLVIGHSLGGIVATAYAAMAPTRAVVNIDQSLQLSTFKASLSQLEPMLKGDEESFQQAIDLMFELLDWPLSADERARLREHKCAHQHVVLGTWAAVFDSTEAELDALMAEMTKGVAVPYLSLHGIDPGPDYAGWLTGLIPTATVELWPDHGHYPHLVAPERFLARVAEFEAQVGS